MKIYFIKVFQGDGSIRTYYKTKSGDCSHDITNAEVYLSKEGIELGYNEDWAEINIPEPDAMEIIKKEVQAAIDNPLRWLSGDYKEENIDSGTRKIAAIKCLRKLSEENQTVKNYFNEGRYISLITAKNFVEREFTL